MTNFRQLNFKSRPNKKNIVKKENFFAILYFLKNMIYICIRNR